MSTVTKMEDQPSTFSPSLSSSSLSNRQSHYGGTPNMDQHNVAAFIGQGVEFKGVIKYQGNVRIDGRLDGEVHADGTLYLGEQAVVSAKISAQSVISKGRINGDITASQNVQLLAPAVMDGAVLTPSLLMEEGVLFNGKVEMNRAKGQET